ncbi:MFS transporter [Shewanella litorisediminis]|uniref:MFS transporter n=1 Tax=Shewanella litorisediminis TaxID=1173586 RepID=A0ABX7G7M2_9GAMM|nr:MFS transporter [Shewanella litorisediminis]MCL2919110.1 MFS transporter [Shewanella litorisediminis]QRH03364.1 MFS transporter [Shewanella litorisediminis]
MTSHTSPLRDKPPLSFWQIFNMCFGFLGIQFGFALQNANVSRIFQTLGASIDDIPILWIAGPLTGLLVQPIVGYLSDNTWNRFGRRRPYFLIGAVLTTLALFIMPHSPYLWVAAGMLWIMDASINIAMEPFRAFVGDKLPESQRAKGFAMQSFFIGIGAVVASALPYLLSNFAGVSNIAPEGEIADTVRYSFYLGGVVLLAAVGWTVISSREYSPEELSRFKGHEQTGFERQHGRTPEAYRKGALLWSTLGLVITAATFMANLDKQLYLLGLGVFAFGPLQWYCAERLNTAGKRSGKLGMVFEVVDDLFHMPHAMKRLALVQFFSWFALFAMWIYTTAAVTSFHYHSSDVLSKAYNDGADWVGVLFASYNGFAALAAMVIPLQCMLLGLKGAHMMNLCLGGLGLMSFYLIADPALLWLPMIGVGFAWASILSVPYAMLSTSLPGHKLGVYMGIFNFFIVIPQLVAATVLGFILKSLFGNEPIYALILGGSAMVLAAVFVLFVPAREQEPGRSNAADQV